MPSRKPESDFSVVEKSPWASNQTTPKSDEAPATTPTELRQLPASTTGNEPRAIAPCTRPATPRTTANEPSISFQ